MSRYIDADVLIVNMRGAFIDHIEEFRAITIIKDAPSIDINPKRGKWIDKGDRYWYCSECGPKDTDTWEWCHGCGADMRGADDE